MVQLTLKLQYKLSQNQFLVTLQYFSSFFQNLSIYFIKSTMIPPRAKSLIISEVEKYVESLKSFKNSNPVIMLGQLKLDRIDHKLMKESQKLNHRQLNKNFKIQEGNKKYQKRKAAITYRSYTVSFKRKLISKIKEINEHTNIGLSKIIRNKARQLNIHPKNIFRWFNTKEIKKKQGGRKALYPQMEERLAQFIINNPKMKRKHILRQAKQIMEDLNIPGREYFNFSKGWYERFRERLVRKKILPDHFKLKKESHSDSDEFDQSYYSTAKKEKSEGKQEYYVKNECKQQIQDYFVKQQYKEDNTNMAVDNFVIFYDEIIKEEIKIERFESNYSKIKVKIKKNETDQIVKREIKQQAKTNTSRSKSINESNFSYSKSLSISIFASDEQENNQAIVNKNLLMKFKVQNVIN